MKSKSMLELEEKTANADGNSFRQHVLSSAKQFKMSWVDLGRSLYTVWKDKLFKEWGFQKFDTYLTKEIGIRKQTGLKLLRSYFFLEKEEPQYLKEEFAQASEAKQLPSYESIDILRRAKEKKGLDTQDYSKLKKNIFEKGRDAVEVRKDLTALMKQREEVSPEETWAKNKEKNIKRLLTTLRSLKREAEDLKILPAALVAELTKIIDRLDIELR